jgi:UDP-N-acetylmuramoylalanine--D-glutamate ligase
VTPHLPPGAYVLVLGLATTGRAVVRRFRGEGETVVVVEEHPAGAGFDDARAEATRLGARVVETPGVAHLAELAGGATLVVPSPGVRDGHPAIQAALDAGVPVRSEIDVAASRARAPIVGITGTNGKTTVTNLAAEMLLASDVRAAPVGNIGRPLIDAVDDDVDVLVVELSSFQLRFAPTFAPRVAVLLNLADDHLDWHGTRAAYEDAKANVFRHLPDDGLLVFNADDPAVVRLTTGAPGRRVAFTLGDDRSAYHPARDVLVAADGRALVPVAELPGRAPHDVANALAASAAALDVGATADGVAAALRRSARLPHRVQPVGQHGGVRFYDDSKATNPHATMTAVAGFDSVVLIAGGRNKGLDLSQLRVLAPRLRGVVAIGEAAGDVEAAFKAATPVVRATSMHDAVREAYTLARDGDAVLLSPACASFDWYSSYAERGDDFVREVAALGARTDGGRA